MEIRIIMQEQEAFDGDTQDEAYAHMHAMRRRGDSPDAARKKANAFVRQQICLARRLAGSGFRGQAMRALSRAMHTLQDATSPAHANFSVAWGNTKREIVDHIPHYATELFDPGPGRVADESTIRAWKYFTGEMALPDDFFGDYFDLRYGRASFRGNQHRTVGTATATEAIRMKRRTVFALIIGGIITLLSWLVSGESSPFQDYFDGGVLDWLLQPLYFFPYIVILVLRPKGFEEFVGSFVIFLQGLMVGFALQHLFRHFFHKNQNSSFNNSTR